MTLLVSVLVRAGFFRDRPLFIRARTRQLATASVRDVGSARFYEHPTDRPSCIVIRPE